MEIVIMFTVFALAATIMYVSKNGVSITIKHEHIHKQDKPVDKVPVGYNSSYGDPEVMRHLDKIYDGGNR